MRTKWAVVILIARPIIGYKRMLIRRKIVGSVLACLVTLSAWANEQVTDSAEVRKNLDLLLIGNDRAIERALDWLDERGRTDVVAPLIHILRYARHHRAEITALLNSLTDLEMDDDWFKWMLWQQTHPEVQPFDGFDAFQARLFRRIDPAFSAFLYAGVKHEIRLEEIAWGGVVKDGIPALDYPKLISAASADYLTDDEPVFGVAINGDVRAYPYRILDWHEMFNDRIGGVPVALAYCTLCGAGILFETQVPGREKPFVFGSSGFLYRSNKLMFDRETHSLWNQFTGRPMVGTLTGSGIVLKVQPVVTTTWVEWHHAHPDTRVLSLDTGYQRDYRPGRPYGDYFASSALMFPAVTEDDRLEPKDQIFGLRVTGAEKAWPLARFDGGRVINDRVGALDIVLIGDATTRTVRAYRAGGLEFSRHGGDLSVVSVDGALWQVTENALEGPDGQQLTRLPGHLAYWFAWSGYLDGADLGS